MRDINVSERIRQERREGVETYKRWEGITSDDFSGGTLTD